MDNISNRLHLSLAIKKTFISLYVHKQITLSLSIQIHCSSADYHKVHLLHFSVLMFSISSKFSGPLKNAIDWASRAPNVWADKPAAIVSAGGGFGGGRSQYHLRQVGVFLNLHFINKPELFVKAFEPPQKFDSDGNLIDPETKEKLKQILLSLQAFTYRLQSK